MENQGKSLLKNTLIYAIGTFGSKVLAFLLLPLYSYYLTKDEFGTYDLFIVSINLLTPLLTLQITDAVYRWLIEKENDLKYRAEIISSGLFVVFILSSVFYLFYYVLLHFYFHLEYAGYFSLLLMLSILLPFFQKVLRGFGDNMSYAISGIITTFLVLILNILFLTKFNLKLESLFLASIISYIIVLIFVLYKINIKKLIPYISLKKKTIKDMVKYSLPLVPNSLSWWLINASDKYLILFYINISANGIYAISTRFPSILMLLNSIFLMAWQDHGISAKKNDESQRFFTKLFNTFIVLELTSVIVLIALSPYIIKYLIDDKFHEAWKYLPLLFLGTAFSAFSAFIGVGYQREKKTKGILITSLIGGFINILTSLSLMPIIGLYAPALGTVLSFLIVYLLRKKETNKFFRINVDNYYFLFLILVSFTFIILVSFENEYINYSLVLISLILFFVLNRMIIRNVYLILLRKLLSFKL